MGCKDDIFYIIEGNSRPSGIVPFIANGNYADWRIVVDKTSLEFFAADNKVVITDLYYPTEDFDIIEIFAENGQIRLGEALFTELKSIWK